MLNSKAAKLLIDTAQAAAGVTFHEVEGQTFAATNGRFTAVKDARPAALKVHTLTGVVEYLKANRDSLDLSKVVIHIEDPSTLKVLGPLGKDQARSEFLVATPANGDPLHGFFGNFRDQEALVVSLQTLFRPTDDRALLLKQVGNLVAEKVRTTADDGVSQEVATRTGGVKVGFGQLVNPVDLVPLRSFPEVVLNSAPFIVRARQSEANVPTVAIYESDGGAWRIDAVAKVADWLEAAMCDAGVDVAVIF